MLYYPDRDGSEARARHETLLREAEAWRLAAEGRPARPPFVRRGARLVGRTLVGLGARLLRYGRAEGAILIELQHPNVPSATLN